MFDAYSRRARLAPAALAALPAIVLLGSGLVDPEKAGSILAMALGAVGIVVCGVVRDAGRRVQAKLWAGSGGSPTLQRLRWAEAPDRQAVERLHERVGDVVSTPLPTEPEEKADPAGAAGRYDEATAELRELTRSREQFPLVFEENANYGFRRNCLGLRPLALVVALAVLATSGALLALGHDEPRFWAAAGVACVALIGWWLLVTERWVEAAGKIYADRLFEAVASIGRRSAGH